MKAITRRINIEHSAGLWRIAFILSLSPILLISEGPNLQERAFFNARHKKASDAYSQEINNPEKAIAYAFAAFDWGEFAEGNAERASIANPAIRACRDHLNSPQEAAANYYLALNLGQLARTKWLGALKIVREMEERLQASRSMDPSLDYGGPDRALSRLYFQAPNWPTSIGNSKKAIKHAKAAIAAAPNYPGNHLLYMEILLDQGLNREAITISESFPLIMKKSRDVLNSEYWKFTWKIWDETWNSIRNQVERTSK